MITFNTTPRFAAMPSATPALPQSQQPAAHSESAAQPMFGEKKRRSRLGAGLLALALGTPLALGASGCGTNDKAAAVEGNGSSSSASAPAKPGQTKGGEYSKAIEIFKTKTNGYVSKYKYTPPTEADLTSDAGIAAVPCLRDARQELLDFVLATKPWGADSANATLEYFTPNFGTGAINTEYEGKAKAGGVESKKANWQLDAYEGTVQLWMGQIFETLTNGKDKKVGIEEWNKIATANLGVPDFDGDTKASNSSAVKVLTPGEKYSDARIKTLEKNGIDIKNHEVIVRKNADGTFSMFFNAKAKPTALTFLEALNHVAEGKEWKKPIGASTNPAAFELPGRSSTNRLVLTA